ncbi:MAG: dickkopf-related protein [Myxococcota bacterium]|nr:dickkopf-related protein [Myxococcota bacterium]
MTNFLRRPHSRWILAIGLALALGCGGDESDGGAGGGGGMGGGTTPDEGVDQGRPDAGPPRSDFGDVGPAECDCPRELTCDEAGECVEVSPCERDTQCIEGRICVDGACADGCADDAACLDADPTLPLCFDGRCGQCETDDQCFGAGTCDVEQHLCVEPAVCSDSRECLGTRVCVGGTCEATPDCRDDEVDCPPGQICSEDGQCLRDPSGACESDADCPVLGHVCLEARAGNICGPCQEDSDCPTGMECRVRADGNACAEPDTCSSDDECIGSRVCVNGACDLPQCADDVYEDNETAETATPIIAGLLRCLVSCGDDADWFEFVLPANNAATVSLRQQDNLANLNLTIRNADGVELVSAQSDQPVEAVVVGPFPSEQTIFAVVDQNQPYGIGSFVLDVALVDEGEACIDDANESGAGDDSPETGRQVRAPGELGFSGDLAGRICPDDLDYICFATQVREEVSIDIEVTSGDAVVAGRVIRVDGETVRNTESEWSRQGGDAVNFRAGAGPYCLELSARSGSGTYRVSMTAVPSAVLRLCEDASPLELQRGQASVQAQLTQDDEFSPICAGGEANGGEVIYSVSFDDEADLPVLLTATVSGLAGGTLGDPVVSIRSNCGDASSEVACSTGQRDPLDPNFSQRSPATARAAITELGTYSIAVDGIDIGDRPNYRLDVDTAPLALAPANDRCNQAQELAFNPDGVTVFGVNLDRANDDVSGCTGDAGPDVVYRLTFLEPANVRLQAAAAGDAFAVSAFLGPDCRARDANVCGFGFETQVEPGVYYLVIDGADANSRGRVTVQMNVESIGAAPVNEVCDSATALDAAGGQLVASTQAAIDDYRLLDANLCTGNNTLGGDVVYTLASPQNQMMYVEAIPEDGWDLALYVVSDCANPARRRVACSDGALTESTVFDVAADEPVFVIVDGSNGESGSFQLRWGVAECRLDVDCAEGQCIDYACVAP